MGKLEVPQLPAGNAARRGVGARASGPENVRQQTARAHRGGVRRAPPRCRTKLKAIFVENAVQHHDEGSAIAVKTCPNVCLRSVDEGDLKQSGKLVV